MPSFDGRNDKIEHFEDIFTTNFKVYSNISEEDQIHYFHSFLRGDTLQTYRKMTDTNRASLEDIITTFHRRYVRPNLWQQLDAIGNNFISTLPTKSSKILWNNVKNMPKRGKGTMHQNTSKPHFMPQRRHTSREPKSARLETESYETMVQHLERGMDLNGLSASIDSSFTGVHQVKVLGPQQTQNAPKPAGLCYGCGHPGHVIKTYTKRA